VAHDASTREAVDDFAAFGLHAFTTTRQAGSFGTQTDEPVRDVIDRWSALQRELSAFGSRLATARQVHGSHVFVHGPGWEGWLRCPDGDGHASLERGTAMAVTVADCTPVFIAHASGAAAVLHAGWRGTAFRILERGIGALAHRGLRASELHVHLGPAICGRCYEVSPDVYGQITGRSVEKPTTVDIRAVLADQARLLGVKHISSTSSCTRCDNDRFFSHRAGDAGRQLGVIIAESVVSLSEGNSSRA
jgi:YfiH family protein